MFETSALRWCITDSRFQQKFQTLVADRSLHVIRIDDLPAVDEYTRLNEQSDADAPCSIYFTSGSTGRPKGILGRLKGIDHFIRWEIETVGAGPGTRVSQLASPSFDGFLKDAFVPLCSGGVACAPESREILLDPGRLIDWIDVEQIEVLHLVPSVFRSLINYGLNSHYFEALRYVLLAGEHLYPADVKRWMDVFGERIKLPEDDFASIFNEDWDSATRKSTQTKVTPVEGWGRLATGGVDVHKIPGNHFSILHEPNVQALGEQLRKCVEETREKSI